MTILHGHEIDLVTRLQFHAQPETELRHTSLNEGSEHGRAGTDSDDEREQTQGVVQSSFGSEEEVADLSDRHNFNRSARQTCRFL